MASYLDIALVSCAAGWTNIAAVALLLDAEEQEERKRYMDGIPRFSLKSLGRKDVKDYFRFEKEDLPRLCKALGLPDEIQFENGMKVPALEALCIVLRRFAHPSRYVDLIPLFGRSKGALSLIVNHTVGLLYNKHKHLLLDLNQDWLKPTSLRKYADAVAAKGSPLTNCWGFIDGTVRPMCRPKINQRVCFNDGKGVHCLKFQAVMVPNGLIANVHGPFEGCKDDSDILTESDILEDLQANMNDQDGSSFYLYGHSGYTIHSHLITPFESASLSTKEELFNARMGAVRKSVKWGLRKVVNLWRFLDDKKNLKLLLQPVGMYYLVGVILTNCHTTLYGSKTSSFFGVPPPSLEDYLSGSSDAE